MLWVGRQQRVMHLGNGRVGLEELRQCQRRGTGLRQPQRQGFGPSADQVGGLGRQCRTHVAQALLADLCQAPLPRVALAVIGGNIGVVRPVEQAGVGECTTQRIAVSANGFGE